MTGLDYFILTAYLLVIVAIGGYFARGQKSLQEFFLGSRNIPWWAVSFSGVATLLSAVAYLGAPGQAFKSDLRYLQYRIGLPLAIFIVCVWMMPLFYKRRVFTIYEYFEQRFDLKTRLLASGIFLLLKVSYMGVVIYAPSLFVAQMTGLPINWVVITLGVLTALYTTAGGIRAVIWTDTVQLIVLLVGLVGSSYVLLSGIDGGLNRVVDVALAEGKLRLLDFSTNFSVEFTVWGGLLGGAVLIVAEYGADQAGMQRFLTTRSLRQGQWAAGAAMVGTAVAGAVLFLLGAALYVFYFLHPEKHGLEVYPDRVFPKFIIEELPAGATGLLIASVLAAAMSTISSVLNSLTTATLSDFYHRLSGKEASIGSARLLTVGFGVICTAIGLFADQFGNLIIATSRLTSFFGGTLVGAFLLGILVRRAGGSDAFIGGLAGFVGVALVAQFSALSWMWYGVTAATITMLVGMACSPLRRAFAGDLIAGTHQSET